MEVVCVEQIDCFNCSDGPLSGTAIVTIADWGGTCPTCAPNINGTHILNPNLNQFCSWTKSFVIGSCGYPNDPMTITINATASSNAYIVGISQTPGGGGFNDSKAYSYSKPKIVNPDPPCKGTHILPYSSQTAPIFSPPGWPCFPNGVLTPGVSPTVTLTIS
jgi:hypothetical protein